MALFFAGCLLLFGADVLDANGVSKGLVLLLGIPGLILAILGLTAIPVVLYHYALVSPFEYRERGRLFLGMLALAEKSGQSIEQTIIEFSKRGNQSFGGQFDRVALHIESGLTLPEALEKVPGCLPTQTVATLKVGYETGNVSLSLPLTAEKFRERPKEEEDGRAIGGGYLVMLLSVATVIVGILMTFVIPKFKAVYADMLGEGETLPEFTLLVLKISDIIKNNVMIAILIVVLFIVCGCVWRGGRLRLQDLRDFPDQQGQITASVGLLGIAVFVGLLFSLLFENLGPIIFFGGISTVFAVGSCIVPCVLFYCDQMGWLDWFRYLVPWCRKRLQRDFSYMLALLLDSGVPEAKALELAAASTANDAIKQRARKAIAAVRSGTGMVKAVQLMDNSKEFQWRLTNALQTEFNFVDALAGWHESLSARADRQQQTYATLMQTSVLFFLGLIVGSIMVGMFLPLIVMMEKLAW